MFPLSFLFVQLLTPFVLGLPHGGAASSDGAAPRRATASGSEPSVAGDSARAAVGAFNWLWRFCWEASETLDLPKLGGPLAGKSYGLNPPPPAIIKLATKEHDPGRIHLLHCHIGVMRGFERPGVNIIESGAGSRAVCPYWYYPTGIPPYDEHFGIDAAITPRLLPALERARDSLLLLLDRAAAAEPADGWIAGERVRFALDAGDTNRALAAALSCHAERWWCLMLEGYVRDGRGDIAGADSIVQAAIPRMPPDDRCVWTDLTLLLDQAGRIAYGDIPCARRDSVNARIWWLAKPLYSEAGNERRTEHFARLVDFRLRSTDAPAERWDLQPSNGGLAIREMVLRYGWPAYSYWAGHFEDIDHYTIYLGITDTTIIDNGIFATAEYPVSRVHTIPWWSAIADPWHAEADDWTVSMESSPDSSGPDFGWWPREHIAHAGESLVQLDDEQSALFRRESDNLLVLATDVRPGDLHGKPGETVEGTFIISGAPDSFVVVRHPSVIGTTVVMQSHLSHDPAVVAMEYRSIAGKAAARTRFGVAPLPSLSELTPGEIAVSQPVLIRPSADGVRPPTSPAAALPLMMSGTTLPKGQRIGVYWETYGIGDGDTVNVSVRVSQRQTPPAAPALLAPRPPGVVSSSNGISVQWTEPAPGRVVATTAGPHPIQSRNVSIDLSGLQPGEYSLEVSVARPGGLPVSGSRELVILH